MGTTVSGDVSLHFDEPLIPTATRGVIWAADVCNAAELHRIMREISEELVAVKVGHPLLWTCGLGVISEIRGQYNLPVIADAKLCDVPDLIEMEVSILYKAGADGVLVVGLAGRESVRRAVRLDPRRMVYVFTEFTHSDGLVDEDLSANYAEMARTAGAYGIQAPGTKPKRVAELRSVVGPELKIISCGIGTQGGEPGSAVQMGANYEIVGRRITKAQDPRGIARQIRSRIGQ